MGLSFEQWDNLSLIAQIELTQAYQRRTLWEMKQQATLTINLLGELMGGKKNDTSTPSDIDENAVNDDESWAAFGV